MAAKNNGLEWFRPLWRRLLITGFCVAWCAFEWLVNKDQFWGWITAALIAYAVWTFFITFDKNVGSPDDGPKS